jgi:RNA polymerase sigma factor (sigma-70 family)
MQDLTDEDLVANFRSHGGPPAGNRWADELFGRYHSKVAIWCYRFTGERDLAGDLAQDVFLRAYRNIDSFRGNAKFSTWLYTIARNHCINEMKSRSVRPEQTSESIELDIEDGVRESILASLEREQSLQSMRALVNEALDEASAVEESEWSSRVYYERETEIERGPAAVEGQGAARRRHQPWRIELRRFFDRAPSALRLRNWC